MEVKILFVRFFFFFHYSFIFYARISCTQGRGGCWPCPSCPGEKAVLHPGQVGSLQQGRTERQQTTIYSHCPPYTHTWNMHTCKHHTGKQQAWFCSIYSFIYLFIHPQKMDSHFGHSEANTPTVTAFHHVHREAFKAHTDQMRTFPQKICRGRALHWWDGNLPHLTFCYQTEPLSQRCGKPCLEVQAVQCFVCSERSSTTFWGSEISLSNYFGVFFGVFTRAYVNAATADFII